MDAAHPAWARRKFLMAGALLATAFAAPGCTPAALATDPPRGARERTRLLMKMMASLTAGRVCWYYTGRIYAVRSGAAPLHLYNFEGTEIYWVTPLEEDRWSLAISTLTFFQDRDSGEYLEQYSNPLNNKTLAVKANVLRTKPGQGAIYADQTLTAFGTTVPISMEIHRDPSMVWLTTSRASEHAPQPSMEVNSIFSPAADIDAARASAPATTSTVSLSRWSKWLEMGELEGHLMWHSAGRKLASIDDLPQRYRQRADALGKQHFENPENDARV